MASAARGGRLIKSGADLGGYTLRYGHDVILRSVISLNEVFLNFSRLCKASYA